MRKSILYFSLIFVVLKFTACGNLMVGNKNRFPEPDKVLFECQGEKYSSDATYIRAMGSGTSLNESTASRMANLDASANLAKAIENYLEKISAYQDNRRMKEGTPEIEWDGGSFSREELNRTLSNVSTICSQTLFDNKMYTTVSIVEIPIEQIIKE